MTTADLELTLLSAALVILSIRIVWYRERLTQPEGWTAVEKAQARVAALALATAALASGLTAAYVATRVPWVDNLPALFATPPQPVAGTPPAPVSTAAYLFLIPIMVGFFAAMLIDPWGARHVSFRGSRLLVLRAIPVVALLATAYSVWHSISALSAAAH